MKNTLRLVTLIALFAGTTAWAQTSSPVVDEAKAKMRELAQTTRAGKYFPSVRVPVDMDTFIKMVMIVGNEGRRDPDFRKKAGKKWATDLSGDWATQMLSYTEQDKPGVPQKIYKDNPTPPYFDDLVVSKELSEACQFHAEYQAFTQKGGHDGPTNFTGGGIVNKDMSDIMKRATHFLGRSPNGVVLEGGGSGDKSPDADPESWMKTETHYRPWFNIEYRTIAIGYGTAQGANGGWYGCKLAIGRTDDDRSELTKLTLLELPREVKPTAGSAPAPAATAATPSEPGKNAEPLAAIMPAQPAASGGPGNDVGTVAVGTGTLDIDSGQGVFQDAAADKVAEVRRGEWLIRGKRYLSGDGGTFLVHAEDSNLVIARTTDGAFIWGLNEQPGVDYRQAQKVAFTHDGRLVALNAEMAEIWSKPYIDPLVAPFAKQREYRLELTEDGILIIRSNDPMAPIWWATQIPHDADTISGDIKPDLRIYSNSKEYFMELHGSDGNFVVARANPGRDFIWGLNLVPGLDFRRIKLMTVEANGRLVAKDATGGEVWSQPQGASVPGSTLRLADTGQAQLVAPDGRILWMSH